MSGIEGQPSTSGQVRASAKGSATNCHQLLLISAICHSFLEMRPMTIDKSFGLATIALAVHDCIFDNNFDCETLYPDVQLYSIQFN